MKINGADWLRTYGFFALSYMYIFLEHKILAQAEKMKKKKTLIIKILLSHSPTQHSLISLIPAKWWRLKSCRDNTNSQKQTHSVSRLVISHRFHLFNIKMGLGVFHRIHFLIKVIYVNSGKPPTNTINGVKLKVEVSCCPVSQCLLPKGNYHCYHFHIFLLMFYAYICVYMCVYLHIHIQYKHIFFFNKLIA